MKTDIEEGVESTTELPWRTRRRFRLHLPVDTLRLDAIVTELSGRALSAGDRRRLTWYRVRCGLRSAGWVIGLLTAAVAVLTAIALSAAALFRLTGDRSFIAAASTLVADALVVGFFAWAYLYLTFAAFDSVTSFSRASMETVRDIPSDSDRWRIATGYSFVNSSGAAARALMRVMTGRRVNVLTRPDVSADAIRVAGSVMLMVPPEGPRFWAVHTREANRYATLLYDVNGLVAAGHPELVSDAIGRARGAGLAEVLVDSDAPEIRKYLHPLGETTAVDAFVRYVLPLMTLVVSIAAVLVTLSRP